MQHPSSHVANSKPVLLACAISFALAACGGSGNDNHTAPEQPQTPAAPQGTPTPPPATDKTPAPKAPQQTPDKPSKPDNKNSNTPAPEKPASPQNPKQGPALPIQATPVPDAQKYSGSAFFAPGISLSGREDKVLLTNIFSTKKVEIKNNFKPANNSFGFQADAINLLLAKDVFDIPSGYKVTTPVTLTLGEQKGTVDLSKAKTSPQDPDTPKIKLKLEYTGKSFGYKDAQALHFYGKITSPDGNKQMPFDVAYSVGEYSPDANIKKMQGIIKYQGYASFRAYKNPADRLATGTASFTLDMTKKAITDATIDLQDSIGKTYSFASVDQPIPVLKTGATFKTENAKASLGLRGYFYGKNAEHIGGAYYTADGGGAFITEKQK